MFGFRPAESPTLSTFADWQPRYAERGIATFPVCDKRPLVRGYLSIGRRTSDQLALKFPDADAFGIACKRNRITVLDVDSPDERLLAEALNDFGPTPFVVRSGSGNFQAWYRRNGEQRHVRPDHRKPIDILGDGFVVCPPSVGSKGRYAIIQGSLDDLQTLPTMRCRQSSGTPTLTETGKRNDTLWRWCMMHAKQCDTICQLTEAAMQTNQIILKQPLPLAEVVQIVTNAWAKELKGENWFGSGSRVILDHAVIDELITEPDVLVLYTKLRRHHWGREFVIANEMASSMSGRGWTRKRLAAAREKLERAGKIVNTKRPSRRTGPGVYKFTD